LTLEQRRALRTYAEALPSGTVVSVLRDWLMAILDEAGPTTPSADPRLLAPGEVAARLKVDLQWVYRRAKKWPFTRRLGRLLRFDPAGFERWLARQDSHRPDPSR
jgi:predicted DNA-binding transcriptional regulator AlpA